MIAEIATALAALKNASDLVGILRKIKLDAAITEKVIESQSAILSAQSAMFELNAKYQELLDGNADLKKQLVQTTNWDTEAAKYELREISVGVFAYALKSDESSTAPSHWLCASCFDQKQKSPLQKTIETGPALGDIYLCGRCQATVFVKPDR